MIRILHWILGIAAGLSLVLGVIFKLIYSIGGVVVFSTSPRACLLFTATCCLASIALSMIELSSKSEGTKTLVAGSEGESIGG